jgi:histidyl-tRNA synthetase
MLGPREIAEGKAAVKDLVSGDQRDVARAEVSAWLRMRKDESAS